MLLLAGKVFRFAELKIDGTKSTRRRGQGFWETMYTRRRPKRTKVSFISFPKFSLFLRNCGRQGGAARGGAIIWKKGY